MQQILTTYLVVVFNSITSSLSWNTIETPHCQRLFQRPQLWSATPAITLLTSNLPIG